MNFLARTALLQGRQYFPRLNQNRFPAAPCGANWFGLEPMHSAAIVCACFAPPEAGRSNRQRTASLTGLLSRLTVVVVTAEAAPVQQTL